MRETWVRSLGWEDPLEKGDFQYSRILPFQYSGLENSRDHTVHGVSKSRTRLSDFHFTSFKSKLLVIALSLEFKFGISGVLIISNWKLVISNKLIAYYVKELCFIKSPYLVSHFTLLIILAQ